MEEVICEEFQRVRDGRKLVGFRGWLTLDSRLIHKKWNPPSYNTLKLNVDTRWDWGITLSMILYRNVEGEIIGLWYNNFNYPFAIATKLMVI